MRVDLSKKRSTQLNALQSLSGDERERNNQDHKKMKEEKEEKAIRVAEMELKKSQNLIEHEDEIKSRPARTWFQSEKEKEKSKGE